MTCLQQDLEDWLVKSVGFFLQPKFIVNKQDVLPVWKETCG